MDLNGFIIQNIHVSSADVYSIYDNFAKPSIKQRI